MFFSGGPLFSGHPTLYQGDKRTKQQLTHTEQDELGAGKPAWEDVWQVPTDQLKDRQ